MPAGGCKSLDEAEYKAYDRARLLLTRGEDGDEERAQKILEEAGFELFYK